MTLRIGSLCSGYRGLDMAVEEVFGGTTAWVSDVDPGANKILAHHWPTTPNIGDLTTTDWGQVEPVDIVCGGYPCQPFSNAGLRKGVEDDRHIWPYITTALGVLRPRLAIFENVSGHLRLGFDAVLADLARLGFDAEWCLVRASEVGAPHQRNRLFILATATDATAADERRMFGSGGAAEQAGRTELGHSDRPAADAADLGHERIRGARGRGHGPADGGDAAADAEGQRLEGHKDFAAREGSVQRGTDADRCGSAAADTQSVGRREGRPEPEGQQGGPGAPSRGTSDWGRFDPAIRRWEHVLGRRAPWATDDRNRLSPAFVEWLMGLPAGHVTDVPGMTRTQQLKALGNGVVPQQAAAAIRLLHARATATAAAA
jgi:DNA (cytosine-5)-methyltransferase 1